MAYYTSTLRIRRHGLSMSMTADPVCGGSEAGERDRPGGWTYGATVRLRNKLQSVDEESLFEGGFVFGITLTYGRKFGIPSSLHVSMDREALLAYARRQGFDAIHWLIEFQRGMYPHFHLVIRHPSDVFAARGLIDFWLRRTSDSGSRRVAQCVKRMESYVGWAKYLAKHAVRMSGHYQRKELPKEWGGYSGRMWGFSTTGFEFQDEVLLEVSDSEWHKIRRILRRELLIHHRSTKPVRGDYNDELKYLVAFRNWKKQICYLRRMFKGMPSRSRERFRSVRLDPGEKEVLRSGWCRSYSTYKPINFWMSSFLARSVHDRCMTVAVVNHQDDMRNASSGEVSEDECLEVLRYISR